MSFSPLEKLIKKRLEKRGLQQGVTESKVFDKTKEVIEEEFSSLAEQIEVLEVKDNKIILKANNSSVAQEIQLQQQQIIKEVNEQVEEAEINKIAFKSN